MTLGRNLFLRNISGTTRVAINGFITWARIVGVLIAKLLTTRLLLSGMGIEGYGVYFAAISVALLVGFLTSAMQATSLRAISLETSDETKLCRLFSSLLGLHFVVAIFITAVGATGGVWIVTTLLDIPADLQSAAVFCFFCILVATTLGALFAPYEAFLQSRERFAIYAFLEVLRAWVLVPVSYYLTRLESGQLQTFAIFTASATMATILVGVVIALRDYPATRPHPKYLFSVAAFRLHGAIFSWTIIGSLSAVTRNQGLTILVNVIGGPVASAAFAVGNQIPAAVRQLATSLRDVIAPRIYGREARGDRNQMLGLAFTACKISMLVTVALAVPLAVEMPTILRLWLGQADPAIVFVASLLLINIVIDESSAGTGIAHMAIGHLARFQLFAGGLSLLMIPSAYIVGRFTGDFRHVLFVAVSFTSLLALTRVALINLYIPNASARWLNETVMRVLAVLLPSLTIALAGEAMLPPSLVRLVVIVASTLVLFLFTTQAFGLTEFERSKLMSLIRRGNRTQ